MKNKKGNEFDNFEDLGKFYGRAPMASESTHKKKNFENSTKKAETNMNTFTFKIPSDTLLHMNDNKYQIDNFNLKFNKYAKFLDDKFTFFHPDPKNPEKNYDITIARNFENNLINSISEKFINSIKKTGILFKSYSFNPEWCLIIGLGSESVYDTSITLHHIYGIPYIPGQAIKGVLRNYVLNEHFGKEGGKSDLAGAEKRALGDKNHKGDEGFLRIFGNEDNQGKVIFFDAFPKDDVKLKPDIMNPHYGPYYSEGKPPGDYYNPVPIFFLTVENTKFEFIIGVKPKHNEKINSGPLKGEILTVVYDNLKKALKDQGIGAKTAVGYGYGELNEI